jgi:hypothetical protein
MRRENPVGTAFHSASISTSRVYLGPSLGPKPKRIMAQRCPSRDNDCQAIDEPNPPRGCHEALLSVYRRAPKTAWLCRVCLALAMPSASRSRRTSVLKAHEDGQHAEEGAARVHCTSWFHFRRALKFTIEFRVGWVLPQQLGRNDFYQSFIKSGASQPHLKTARTPTPTFEAECGEMGDNAARNLWEAAVSDKILSLDFIDLKFRGTDSLTRCGNGLQAQQHCVTVRRRPVQHPVDLVECSEVDAE